MLTRYLWKWCRRRVAGLSYVLQWKAQSRRIADGVEALLSTRDESELNAILIYNTSTQEFKKMLPSIPFYPQHPNAQSPSTPRRTLLGTSPTSTSSIYQSARTLVSCGSYAC